MSPLILLVRDIDCSGERDISVIYWCNTPLRLTNTRDFYGLLGMLIPIVDRRDYVLCLTTKSS